MPVGILGRKVGMTQIFTPEGRAVPVTVVEAGPCTVMQTKTLERDGYTSVQLGFGEKRENRTNKPLLGHFAKANAKPVSYLREFALEEGENLTVGQEIKADMFKEGEIVDVVGTSKGKGFAGAIKRHNFNRAAMSHGSMYHRRPGSLSGTDPARVFKGRRLPGHLGMERVTTRGLEVVRVDAERNLLLIKGSVPGSRGGMVLVKRTTKRVKQAK
ncbi:MAG TPA: 50S ribosomal protein L3 [Firmicutes bacterium]|nr:50S ribosomal protein L3 [Bacillota bacterium]